MALIPPLLSPQRGPSALSAPAVATINHLLAREAWARESLKRHAGKVACIDTGHLRLCMRVARDGMLETAAAASEAGGDNEVANVTIHVKLGDLPLILQNSERAFSYVRIDGDAEFANTISQLSKGLRWDAENDLERFIGPIAAARLAGGARGAVGSASAAGRRLAENVAEFLLEERRVLVRPKHVEGFGDEINRLRDDVERSAKRIARLEQRLQQMLPAAADAAPSVDAAPAVIPALLPIVSDTNTNT
jgi:ubiquinone biosynthesis protein UbiJ